MNKKLMAVAVAGALGTIVAPAALAQFSAYDGKANSSTGSTVTISGRLNFFYGVYNTGNNGATQTGAASTNSKLKYDALNNSESEIDISGQEDLGGGHAAWFQCGSTIDITGGSAANGTGGICGRNSAVGMKGSWGNGFVGNWDTPLKAAIIAFQVFPVANPIGVGIMWNTSTSNFGNRTSPATATLTSLSQMAQTGGGAGFWRRQSRLMTYVTPVWKGFQASIATSAANEASAASTGSGVQKARLYSFGSNYRNGPLGLGAAYEIHHDYNPGALLVTGANGGNYAGGTSTALSLAAGYKFLNDSVVVNAQWVHMDYQVDGNLNTTQTNWNINGSWNISGPHTIKLMYVDMGSTGGTYGGGGVGNAVGSVGTITANGGAGNTGAKKYVTEYQYAFSKRTSLNFGYAKLNNDGQANQNIGTGSTAAGFGESQSFYGLRMDHRF